MPKYRFATPLTCALWLGAFAACENDHLGFGEAETETGESALDGGVAARNYPPGSPGGSGTSTDAATSADPGGLPPSVSMTTAGTLLCGSSLCQCNNGLDDDGDGSADGFDAECTGALDDEEESFATGIPGDNRDPKWQDCFFDGNSGAGDDRCRYPTECLTGDLSQQDPACSITETCRNNCAPLAPNGCDCFGCCSVRLPDGGNIDVTLSASCSLENVGDEAACPPCSKSTACGNECGECELCFGKTAADLPESCRQDPPPDPNPPADPNPPVEELPPPDPTPTCEGLLSCSPEISCPMGYFCSLGCCIVQIR